MKILHTKTGLKFGLTGEKGSAPLPTLFVPHGDVREGAGEPDSKSVEGILAGRGFLVAFVEMPCHGEDVKEGEPPGLEGWRSRIERGDDVVSAFTAKISALLDHLIEEGYTDADRVGIYGFSRGGFLALHVAAAEPRVRCTAPFGSLMDLLCVREFAGMEENQMVKALSPAQHAAELAHRAVFIGISIDDYIVHTDDSITVAMRIAEQAAAQGIPPNVELYVAPPVGHTDPRCGFELAAAWFLEQMGVAPEAAD